MRFYSTDPESCICQSAFRPDRPAPETHYWKKRTLRIYPVGFTHKAHLLVNPESSGGEDIICTWFQMSDDEELRKWYWHLYPGEGAGGIFCLRMEDNYRRLYIDPINVFFSLHLPNEHGTVMMPRQAFFQLLHEWLVKYNETYLKMSDTFFPHKLNYSLIPGLSEDDRAKLALYAPLNTRDSIACAGLDPRNVEAMAKWWKKEKELHPDDYTAMEMEWEPEQSIPQSDYWGRIDQSPKDKYRAWRTDGVSLIVFPHSYTTIEREKSAQSDSALNFFDASDYGCLHDLYERLAVMVQKPPKPTLFQKALGLLPWKAHKPKIENTDPLDMKIPTPFIVARDQEHHRELTVRLEDETAVFCYESFRNAETLMGEPITVDECYDEQTLPADAALELTASLLVQHNLQKIEPQRMVLFPDKLDYSQIPGLSCRAAFEKLRPANTLDALSHPELIRDEVYLVSDWIQKHYPKKQPWQVEEQPVYQPRNDWESFDPFQYVWISGSENGLKSSYWAVGDEAAYEDRWSWTEYTRFTVCGNTVIFSKPAKLSVFTRWFRLQSEEALFTLWWRLWEYENGLSTRRIWHEDVSGSERLHQTVVAHIQYGKKGKEVAVSITRDGRTLWNTLPRKTFMEVLSAVLVTRKLFGVIDPHTWEDVNPEPGENIPFLQELDYAGIPGLSEEAAARFERWRPRSYWDALCIPGHARADILTVVEWLKQN